MSAASAYNEKWPGAEIDLGSILGSGARAESDAAALKLKELEELLTTILPARMAGSDAASRDLVKICTIMNDIVKRMEEALSMATYERYRVHPDLDIWVIPGYAHDVLGCDPVALQRSLEANYPAVGRDQDIQPNTVQWVDGGNVALNYRGSELKRSKMWFQRGDPREVGYTKYYYTGWQKDILPATSDVAACPELAPLADKYDEWAASVGYPSANHYIVTRYEDGSHNIGYHFDKAQSIAPTSLITVVKTGECGRRFQLRHRVTPERAPGETNENFKKRCDRAQAQEKALFDEVLAPGTAVIMTLEANLRTQHGVPEVPESGPSGSWVARTIFERVPYGKAKRTQRKKRAAQQQTSSGKRRRTTASQNRSVDAAPEASVAHTAGPEHHGLRPSAASAGGTFEDVMGLQPSTTPVVQTAAATAAEGEQQLYRTHVLGMPCIEVESARPASSASPPPRCCDAGEPVTEQPIARTSEAADLASPHAGEPVTQQPIAGDPMFQQ